MLTQRGASSVYKHLRLRLLLLLLSAVAAAGFRCLERCSSSCVISNRISNRASNISLAPVMSRKAAADRGSASRQCTAAGVCLRAKSRSIRAQLSASNFLMRFGVLGFRVCGPATQNIENVRYRTLSFFFMGMMAVMTLVIQGSTTGLLLQVAAPARNVNDVAGVDAEQARCFRRRMLSSSPFTASRA